MKTMKNIDLMKILVNLDPGDEIWIQVATPGLSQAPALKPLSAADILTVGPVLCDGEPPVFPIIVLH